MVSKEVALASGWLARRRIGGLIVLARESGLQEYVEAGIALEPSFPNSCSARVFPPPAPSMMVPSSSGGPGGRHQRCVLPLTETREVQGELGTRHRAGAGLSGADRCAGGHHLGGEGAISLVVEGAMERGLDEGKNLSAGCGSSSIGG